MEINKNKIIGIYEEVGFPEFGIKSVLAKIDTGAFSGAIHATNIIEQKNEKGKKELVFYPLGKLKYKFVTRHYSKTRVRSSNGQLEERYKIKTIIKVHKKKYPITITLSNRSAMKKEVLLGRNFLSTNNFLINPNHLGKH